MRHRHRLARTAAARAITFAALAVCGCAAPAAEMRAQNRAPAAPTIDTMAIREHTRYLADDRLAGRGTGTEGERIAAAYIASQLTRIGARPLGAGGSYLLPIPLRRALIDPASRLVVSSGADSAVFRSGPDFIVNTGGADAFRSFNGRARFYGQPVHALARMQRERPDAGTVAVFLGPLGGSAVELVPALIDAGVSGVVLLVTDAAQYDLYVRSRGAERFFVDARVDDPVWQPALPVLIAGPTLAGALLAGARVPEATVQGEAGPAVDLARTVAATIRADIADVPAANVGGVITGSDPALRDEYVVYTAHYDHLGISTPDASGDSIYNGFSDNAAGVAMLLAIAQNMSASAPARSVAFLFFTGEERGLLGSAFMAARPPFPLDRVAALINLDAGAPPAPPVSWSIRASSDAPLARLATDVAARNGWTARVSAASPNSDYWPFLQRGVDAVFIVPGDTWENVTTEQRDALRRRWDRYHQAGDHWHADFPFAGLRRYAEYALLLGRAAASR